MNRGEMLVLDWVGKVCAKFLMFIKYCKEWEWFSFLLRDAKLVFSFWGDVEFDRIFNKFEAL